MAIAMRVAQKVISGILAFFLAFMLTTVAGMAGEVPVEQFGRRPEISKMSLSPDGKSLVYLQQRGKKLLVVSISVDGLGEASAVDFGDFDPREIYWINSDYYLVIAGRARKGAIRQEPERSRMIAVHRENKVPPKIMLQPDTGPWILSGGEGNWKSEQGRFIHTIPDDPDHFLAYWAGSMVKVNIRTGRKRTVFTPAGQGNFLYVVYPDMAGDVRLYTTGKGKILYRNLKGLWHEITVLNIDAGDKASLRQIAFDKDPRYGYAIMPDEEGDRSVVVRVDFEADRILEKTYSHDLVDVHAIRWHGYGQEIIGVTYIVDQQRIQFLNPEWERRQRALELSFQGFSPRITSSSTDKKHHVVVIDSPTTPTEYYYYDEEKRSVRKIRSAYPQFASGDLAVVDPVSYRARDGAVIRGYLTLPNGKDRENLPLVVLPHDWPEARDSLAFDYMAQFLASRGYAVFQPNFRGSSGYGAKFSDAGDGEWAGMIAHDIMDGVLYLVEQGIADPSRMCIVGSRFGGYSSLIAAIESPDFYKCAVSVNGVSDPASMFEEEMKGRKGEADFPHSAWTDHIDLQYREPARLIAGSPLRRVDKIEAPVLLLHAKTNRTVPVEQSRKMANALLELGKSVSLIEFEGDDHLLLSEASRLTVMKAMDGFLAEHLN